jgi:hypothetical protein
MNQWLRLVLNGQHEMIQIPTTCDHVSIFVNVKGTQLNLKGKIGKSKVKSEFHNDGKDVIDSIILFQELNRRQYALLNLKEKFHSSKAGRQMKPAKLPIS